MRIPFCFYVGLFLSLAFEVMVRAEAPNGAPEIPKVSLLTGGSSPKSVLKFDVEAGDEQKWWIERTTVMEMEITDPTGEFTNFTPKQIITRPIVLTAEEIEVLGTTGVGEIEVESALVDFHVTPGGGQTSYSLSGEGDVTDLAAENRAGLEKLLHRPTRYILNDRGQLVVPPPVKEHDIQQQSGTEVDSLLAAGEAVFPEEPVGPGARWKVNRIMVELGVKLEVTTTFELVSRADGICRLKFEIEGKGEPTITTQAGEPEGWYLEHTLISLKGEGESAYSAGLLRPVESKMSLNMNQEMIKHMVERKALMTINASIRFKMYDEPLEKPGEEKASSPPADGSAANPQTEGPKPDAAP